MTGDQIEKVLNRALSDEAFLQELLGNPRAAAGQLGVTFSDEEVDTLGKMTREELLAFAAEYRSTTDHSKRRAAC